MSDPTASDWQPSKRLERGNAAEQILEDLRDRILRGQFSRGAKLPTEKQMAEGYGVSGATIREAIRGLVTAQLVEVRHGSGAYVTAQKDQLIAASLSSMIQIERIGVPQVLGVLGALLSYAAELAAKHATAEDIEGMRQALRRIEEGDSAQAISGAVIAFIEAIGQASGNSLLAALCRFFVGIQVDLGANLSGGTVTSWRATTASIGRDRLQVFKAIEARDPAAAKAAALAFHERALEVIIAQPNAATAMVSDPALTALLSSVLRQKAQGDGNL
ncbi:FadR/GntR family transcriptional regulator [Paraburkholderia susongensis]|uniref:DNA-binding transcriptional regulator, FadR family n=1 Tax=Paraburkholderia susongensis TaxID=1515439 RepID=A0A1X7M317_9BURK|nr:GntR family transcriptional regulator [Paraburkholderia susongensis]SMG60097.1 DNA-binding transcriptional regulator, FadR family [Paraburkholderia susongensis]